MTTRWRFAATAITVFSLGGSARAAEAEATPARLRTAVFLTAAGDASPALVNGVGNALAALERTLLRDRLMMDDALRPRLGPNAVFGCGTDTSCIANLGARAGAEMVLYGRAKPRGAGGITLHVLVLRTNPPGVERDTTLEIAAAADIARHLAGLASELWGLERTMARATMSAAALNPAPSPATGSSTAARPGPAPAPSAAAAPGGRPAPKATKSAPPATIAQRQPAAAPTTPRLDPRGTRTRRRLETPRRLAHRRGSPGGVGRRHGATVASPPAPPAWPSSSRGHSHPPGRAPSPTR